MSVQIIEPLPSTPVSPLSTEAHHVALLRSPADIQEGQALGFTCAPRSGLLPGVNHMGSLAGAGGEDEKSPVAQYSFYTNV